MTRSESFLSFWKRSQDRALVSTRRYFVSHSIVWSNVSLTTIGACHWHHDGSEWDRYRSRILGAEGPDKDQLEKIPTSTQVWFSGGAFSGEGRFPNPVCGGDRSGEASHEVGRR